VVSCAKRDVRQRATTTTFDPKDDRGRSFSRRRDASWRGGGLSVAAVAAATAAADDLPISNETERSHTTSPNTPRHHRRCDDASSRDTIISRHVVGDFVGPLFARSHRRGFAVSYRRRACVARRRRARRTR
jgi:hypothetical protein